ncbi:thiol:disulfide interchange protein DsbA/DsbL [Porticoccus sp. GXU_MW_L64]
MNPKRIRRMVFVVLMCTGLMTNADQPTEKPYRLLEKPLANPPDVLEVFQYSCPHCLALHLKLKQWREEQNATISTGFLPVGLSKQKVVHAKLYYVAQAVNRLDELHLPIYNQLKNDRRSLDSEEQAAQFIHQQTGIYRAKIEGLIQSKIIADRQQAAMSLAREWRVTGTPVVVVKGRYLITLKSAGGFNNVIPVIERLLIEKGEEAK